MLSALKGVGPKTQEKLLHAFGTEEDLVAAAKNLELDRFTGIRGVSPRMAVELISDLLGVESFPFVRTEAAEVLHQDIIQRIQSLAQTPYARNKALLLRPLRDVAARQALLSRVLAAKERVRQLPLERVTRLLARLPALKRPRPVFDSSKVVVVEDRETLARLEPYGRYCEVVRPEDLVRPEAYDLILFVSSTGGAEVGGEDQVHVVLGSPEPWQLFPESVVDFFRGNEGALEALRDLAPFVEGLGVAEEVLALLSTLHMEPPVPRDEALEAIVGRLNEALKERLSRLSLEGTELVELLERGLPRRLEEVFLEVLEEGQEEILRRTGLRIHLEPAYPLALEAEEVEAALRASRQRAKMAAFEALQRAARLLATREEEVREAHRRALEFDFETALGRFALEYDLQSPRWGQGLRLRGALHLGLADAEDAQRVDYTLPSEDRISLLTGANSGGKTTLLETVAQACILGAMGLPVNAREAVLEPVDACYYFSRQRPLSAGALEGFLTSFMPLALDGDRKVVLADELEAMTEPEAAAAVVASFLDLLRESGSYAVVVTHAARAIAGRTEVRVDGIEARGLDGDFNLLVDRTPKPNHIARSTPELILQRLCALREGEEARLYRRILEGLKAS